MGHSQNRTTPLVEPLQMSQKPYHPLFSPRARRLLVQTAQFCQRKGTQTWRVRQELTTNLYLMRELYRIADRDPLQIKHLLDQAEVYTRYKIESLHQGKKYIDPTHPNVMNNPNHPLNPSNPLNLELNPALNLLFQQDMAEKKIAEENEQEEKVDNQMHDIYVDKNMLDTNINPYQVLGVKPTDKHEAIELACMVQLVEHDQASNHKYEKIAAAAAMIGTEHGHHEHKGIFETKHELLKEERKNHLPQFRPPTTHQTEKEKG